MRNIFDKSELCEGRFYLRLLAQFLVTLISFRATILAFVPLYSTPANIRMFLYSCSTVAPWVTFELLVAGKMTLMGEILSMVIQLLGGISAVSLLKHFPELKVDIHSHLQESAGGGMVELALFIIASFRNTLRLLNTNDPTPEVILRLMMTFIPKDLNTAVSLAVAILHEDQESWNSLGSRVLGPFLGAIAAAIYKVVAQQPVEEELRGIEAASAVPLQNNSITSLMTWSFNVRSLLRMGFLYANQVQNELPEGPVLHNELGDVELQRTNAREPSGSEVEGFNG